MVFSFSLPTLWLSKRVKHIYQFIGGALTQLLGGLVVNLKTNTIES